MSPRAAAVPAILAALALAAPACTSGTIDASDASGTPGGAPSAQGDGGADIAATIVQQRSDVAERTAQIVIVNMGVGDVVIGDLAVVDARFTAPATRVLDRSSRIPAGRTISIRVALPTVDCDAGHRAPTTVEVAYERDARAATTELDAHDTLDFLPGLHERECRVQRLAEAATLAFVEFSPSASGEPATLVLEALPTGTSEARLVSIRNTNLLRVVDDAEAEAEAGGDADGGGNPETDAGAEATPLGVVLAGTEPIRLALPLQPFRCDAHAVQEDKRGTVFTIEVAISGATSGMDPAADPAVPSEETGLIELPVPTALKGRILSWVLDWCGLG